MKQVVARAGKVTVVDVPAPTCDPNGVLVRNSYSLISTGTESWTIDSTEPLSTSDLVKDSSRASKAVHLSREVLRQEGVSGLIDYVQTVRNPEVALGYSSAGTVTEVGRNVRDIVVGDRVACAGEGKACHAEIVSVPRNLLANVPEGLPLKHAAFSTVGAIATHAVRTSGPQIGETVGVIGVGLVGNLVAQVARNAGCRVVCLDMRDDRLSLAKDSGADLTLRSADPSLVNHVSHFTDGQGLDHVLVCAATASSEPLNLAGRIAKSGGKVVVVGRVGMDIERKDFFQKELKLLMSRSLGPGRYDPLYEEKGIDYPIEYVRWTLNRNMEAFLGLVASSRVDVQRLIASEFPLERAAEAYESLGGTSGVAFVLSYPERHTETQVRIGDGSIGMQTPAVAGKQGPTSVGLVGPGNFAKETLIPILRSSRDYRLKWVVASNPLHATQAARRYGFEHSTADLAEALNDPELDTLVIASPNNLHTPMLAQTIKAGKTAMIEKPLCVTREEFEEVKQLHRTTGAPIIVGFNRRYAPLVLQMKQKMASLDGPFLITYRVNAGFVAASRWSQDANVGGGRIIHECCHFFDLFNFLLNSDNPSVQVSTSGVNNSSSVARDNLSVSLKYPDGSLATLVYVAMGSKEMDRERIEVFAQGTSIVLDDFKELRIFGAETSVVRLPRPDKGHASEFAELAKMKRGESSSIISSGEVFAATELTFRVDEAARKASGD